MRSGKISADTQQKKILRESIEISLKKKGFSQSDLSALFPLALNFEDGADAAFRFLATFTMES